VTCPDSDLKLFKTHLKALSDRRIERATPRAATESRVQDAQFSICHVRGLPLGAKKLKA
jgi:hypothetical protein